MRLSEKMCCVPRGDGFKIIPFSPVGIVRGECLRRNRGIVNCCTNGCLLCGLNVSGLGPGAIRVCSGGRAREDGIVVINGGE